MDLHVKIQLLIHVEASPSSCAKCQAQERASTSRVPPLRSAGHLKSNFLALSNVHRNSCSAKSYLRYCSTSKAKSATANTTIVLYKKFAMNLAEQKATKVHDFAGTRNFDFFEVFHRTSQPKNKNTFIYFFNTYI